MMTRLEIERTKNLAREFMDSCDAVIRAMNEGDYRHDGEDWKKVSVDRFNSGRKETGALRRKSLDLTRALADLRRP